MGWLGDKQNRTDAAFDAASRFLYAESVDKTTLPEPLSDDYFANYLLASYWLHFADVEQDNSERGKLAEKSLRRTLQLQPDFARAHRNLALALLLQDGHHFLAPLFDAGHGGLSGISVAASVVASGANWSRKSGRFGRQFLPPAPGRTLGTPPA
mgnify:CR=1 FL=1